MKIDISQKGAYQVLRIEEELNIVSDLSELRFLINGYIQQGKRFIAVSFCNVSYIYSGAIAVLIDCFKRLKNENGELCLLEPHADILSIFRYLNLDQLIPIYSTLDELPNLTELTDKQLIRF
ncbi:MAG: STAS domain-containing protein [Fibrobacter sp.]|nr:STAS domain-containing protein [Fibrobacter sp.]